LKTKNWSNSSATPCTSTEGAGKQTVLYQV
jgi:hypothetical protein